MDLGGPLHVIPHDKVESNGELLNFISVLFTLEPKIFLSSVKISKMSVNIGKQKTKP